MNSSLLTENHEGGILFLCDEPFLTGALAMAAVELDWLVQAKQGSPVSNSTREQLRSLSRMISGWIKRNGLDNTKEKISDMMAPIILARSFADMKIQEARAIRTLPELTPLITQMAGLLERASRKENLTETELRFLMNFCLAFFDNVRRYRRTHQKYRGRW